MSISSSIKNFVEQMLISARIVSPRFADYRVDRLDYYAEPADFEQILRSDVVQIIQDEIEIQMKAFADPGTNESRKKKGTLEVADSIAADKFGRAVGATRNPGGFMTGALGMIPHAAIPLLALALAPYIIEEITKPGAIFDKRWKRIMEKEYNAFLSREDQRNTQVGLRQVIISSKAGWQMNNGVGSENTLRMIREGTDGVNDRLAEIGWVDHSRRLF